MDAQQTRYRTKIILIVAVIFAALWLFFVYTAPFDTSAAQTGLSPFFLLTAAFIVALFVLWFSLEPIDKELIEAKSELDAQLSKCSAQVEATSKDIKRAKDSIELANKSRHEFLSTMSRELRVPLNTIIGYSTLLYQQDENAKLIKSGRQYAFDINKAAMHLLMIVNDILDISNLSTGTSDLRIEKISIHKLMECCHRLAEIRGTKPGLALLYDLPDEDITLACDPSRISQIMLNLVSNAITFTDPPGVIRISVRETDEGYVEFIVEDEGIGIPVDDMEMVLQRFGRVDSLTYTVKNQDSTGLGLTLVQELTAMHDGQFLLKSKEDVGTTATVRIPNDLMVNTRIHTDPEDLLENAHRPLVVHEDITKSARH